MQEKRLLTVPNLSIEEKAYDIKWMLQRIYWLNWSKI